MMNHAPLAGGGLGRDAAQLAGATLMPGDGGHRSRLGYLLEHLNEVERAQVIAAGTKMVLYRGTPLFSHGTPQDGIYLVETGRIKVFYVGPSGRTITLAYWHPGTFVGAPDVFANGFHTWSGIAAINSSVLHLSGDTLRALVLRMPSLALGIIEGLSFKGRCYSALAQMLATRSAAERLAHLLLQLADLYGMPGEQGIWIDASFTHADLSHMIGVTRQWITATLQRYRECGIVDMKGRRLALRDLGFLHRLRDGEIDGTTD